MPKMIKVDFPYLGIDQQEFVQRALNWANQHSHFAYFNSNKVAYPHQGFKNILAVGAKNLLSMDDHSTFSALKALRDSVHLEKSTNNWLVGFLGYDLKNDLEDLESANRDHLGFPDAQFFNPIHLFEFGENEVELLSDDHTVFEQILNTEISHAPNEFDIPVASVDKDDYLINVDRLRNHIEEGDCYEINYCQEFHGEIHGLNAVSLYLGLNDISPNPFSCLQKFDGQYIVSASPERFVKQEGETIVSQPIKGTRHRSDNANEDIRLKTDLRNDPKELAENMMIVDLVRNDLARTSETGSVKVEEIFGIYSFPQVHQMISTITSQKRAEVDPIEVIEKAFPMGSMTGAPKVKVMELIEQYENMKRGPFSGAAGYINGKLSFDFNVLIRSIFINEKTKTYSFQVGGAITYDSVPEKEYEECLLKAKAIFELIKKFKETNSPLSVQYKT